MSPRALLLLRKLRGDPASGVLGRQIVAPGQPLSLGLNTHEGAVTLAPVAEEFGLPLTPLSEVLS